MRPAGSRRAMGSLSTGGGRVDNLRDVPAPLSPNATIAYLGPEGTFSEEALTSEEDLASCKLTPMATIADAIRAAASGEADFAFVPIENSIEGSVPTTFDELIFGSELFIQREVVIEIHIDLLAKPGVTLGDLVEVISYSHALGQCRRFLAERLPGVRVGTANSTADAARVVAQSDRRDVAALSPPITSKIYGLSVLEHAVEDQLGNETRFVLVGPNDVQPPSGNDRTAIVCFQRADRPGSLLDLLQVFSERGLNLSRIESRPTKLALGHYCFVIEIDGHVADPVVSDALVVLYDRLEALRFLGSYPVSRRLAESPPVPFDEDRPTPDEWMRAIARRIRR